MAKKLVGKAVSIVGVATFDNRKEYEAQRREMTVLSHSILSGAVHAYGLAYPAPGVLPVDEAAVTALTVGPEGALYGVTSGKRAHLFWMPRPLMFGPLGVIEGVRQAAEGLAVDHESMLYGAARDKGGPLFRFDTTTGFLGLYRNRCGPITLLPAPFRDDGVISLTISHDRKTLAGIGEKSGRLFIFSTKTGRTKRLKRAPSEGESFGRALCAAADNHFYGSGADGRLFRLSVEGDIERLDAAVPCRAGKPYLARVDSFVRARSGKLYGGSEEGYLFSFDPANGALLNHGKGNDIPDLHALAEGADGSIYGLTGRGEFIAHLVRFQPAHNEWADLGLFQSYGHYPWQGYQMRALTAGPEGRLYAGEHDRMGHVVIYYPPVECVKAGAVV